MPADNRTVLNEFEDQSRENVILGLECCADGASCEKCPHFVSHRYGDINNCTARLAADALALIKDQAFQIDVLESLRRIEREGR